MYWPIGRKTDLGTEKLGPAGLLHHQLCFVFSESMCNTAPVIVTGASSIAVELVALLFNIREVQGSNLGPETGIPDRYFMALLSPAIQILEYYPKLGATASIDILSSSFTDPPWLT